MLAVHNSTERLEKKERAAGKFFAKSTQSDEMNVAGNSLAGDMTRRFIDQYYYIMLSIIYCNIKY